MLLEEYRQAQTSAFELKTILSYLSALRLFYAQGFDPGTTILTTDDPVILASGHQLHLRNGTLVTYTEAGYYRIDGGVYQPVPEPLFSQVVAVTLTQGLKPLDEANRERWAREYALLPAPTPQRFAQELDFLIAPIQARHKELSRLINREKESRKKANNKLKKAAEDNPQLITFGKYKGQTVREVHEKNPSYLQWYTTLDTVDPAVKTEIAKLTNTALDD